MDERRRHERFATETLDIRCNILFADEVKLLNISMGGASVTSTKKLNFGMSYKLRIDCGYHIISLNGVVVREKLTRSVKNSRNELVPVYEVGLSFTDLLSETGAMLSDFLKTQISPMQAEQSAQGLRIGLTEAGKANIVEYHMSCSITRISLGGALMLTEKPLQIDSEHTMEIAVPGDPQPLKINGRIAYCKEVPGKLSSWYETGVEFLGLKENDRIKLRDIIRTIPKQ